MDEDAVLALWEQMKSGNAEQATDASQKMNEFCQNPESVMIIMNITQNHSDTGIKQYSIVFLYRLLNIHHEKLSEAWETIAQQIIDVLQSGVDYNSKMILCDMLAKYYKLSILQFDDLFAASTHMLQSENKKIIPIGLYLASILIDSKHISSFPADFVQYLVNESLQFIQKPLNYGGSSYDLFRISYCFFHSLVDIIELDEIFESAFQPVVEYLQSEFDKVYSGQSSDKDADLKTTKYFDLLASLSAINSGIFPENFAPIVPEINSRLLNKDIKIETRKVSLNLLTAISESMPDLLEDINLYIKNTSLFAIELFEETEDLNMVYLPSEIYQNICLNFDDLDPSEIFEKFIPNISELDSMENIGGLIALFMILDSIYKYCCEGIVEQFECILPFIVKGISSGNPFVLDVVSTVISDFCKADSSIACTILSKCEQNLLQYVEYDYVVAALKDIYDLAGKEPSDQSLSFKCLVEQVLGSSNQYHVETVVECIGYLIISVESITEEFVNQLHPILLQLLETKDIGCCASILFCLSAIAFKTPNMIKEDIPLIIEVITSGIPEKDISFNHKSATLVTNFVDLYPQSFAEYCPKVLTSLISIICDKELYSKTKDQIHISDDDDDQDIRDKENEMQALLEQYSHMRDDVFSAIATIFSTYSTELADQSDEIAQIITSSCYGNTFGEEEDLEEMLINLSGFYQSLKEIIPAFIKIGKDPDNLVRLLFESRIKMHYYDNNVEDAVSFWDSLKIIVSKCGAPFISKYGSEMLNIVAETYENKEMWKIYSFNTETKSRSTKTQKFCMRKEFISPITQFISWLFKGFGVNGWLADTEYSPHQFVEKGVEILQFIMNSSRFAIAQCSYGIATIAVTCGNDSQFDALIESVLNNVFPELINSKISESREAAYDTISMLIYNQNKVALSMFNDPNCIQTVLESTQSVIEDENNYQHSLVYSAVMLWCGIVMIFDVEINAESLKNVLNFLPPPPYSPMLEFVAQFAAYAYEKWPEIFDLESLLLVGISIFASTNNYIRNIKEEHMKMFAEVLKNAPKDKIEEELKSDENSMMTIQAHIEQITNGS